MTPPPTPPPKLDETIHQPARLRIMAALMALPTGEQAEFLYLRSHLGLTDGNLGAHLIKLEEAGYIDVEKTFVGRKPRTYVAPTAKGRRAFREHVKFLEQIIRSNGEQRS